MKIALRVVYATVLYVVGVVLTGMIAGPLRLPTFSVPVGISPQQAFVGMLIATPFFAMALTPLAMGLSGSWMRRYSVLFLFVFVSYGVNVTIEGMIFIHGGTHNPLVILHQLLPSAFLALGLTPRASLLVANSDLDIVPRAQWGFRLIGAWLSFPVIYTLFGMCVAPFVVPAYNAGVAGLHIPPMRVIWAVQLFRSALFLAASLPLILAWSKSRMTLFVAMGLAHAFAVGVFGLSQAVFFPMLLRVAHSIEITADSFAYAGVLVLLFTRAASLAGKDTPVTSAAAASTASH